MTSSVLEPPSIAGYSLVRELGRGGMGVVYLAQQTSLDRPVAVKMLGPDALGDPSALRRLRKESSLMKSLAHPNIVRLLDIELDAPQPFLVFEYIPGDASVDSLIHDGGRDVTGSVPILIGIARALEYLHSQGTLHRDLKPANILLAAENVPRLIDFGLARSVSADDTRQTQAGMVVGTLSYMAPEVMEGRDATAAADVYAWALVAYELLGRRFFFSVQAQTGQISATERFVKPVPGLAQYAPSVPDGLADLVMACLDRDPPRRPTIQELRRRLEARPWTAVDRIRAIRTAKSGHGGGDATAVRASPFAPTPPPATAGNPPTGPEGGSAGVLARLWRGHPAPLAIAVASAVVVLGALIVRTRPWVQREEIARPDASTTTIGPDQRRSASAAATIAPAFPADGIEKARELEDLLGSILGPGDRGLPALVQRVAELLRAGRYAVGGREACAVALGEARLARLFDLLAAVPAMPWKLPPAATDSMDGSLAIQLLSRLWALSVVDELLTSLGLDPVFKTSLDRVMGPYASQEEFPKIEGGKLYGWTPESSIKDSEEGRWVIDLPALPESDPQFLIVFNDFDPKTVLTITVNKTLRVRYRNRHAIAGGRSYLIPRFTDVQRPGRTEFFEFSPKSPLPKYVPLTRRVPRRILVEGKNVLDISFLHLPGPLRLPPGKSWSTSLEPGGLWQGCLIFQ